MATLFLLSPFVLPVLGTECRPLCSLAHAFYPKLHTQPVSVFQSLLRLYVENTGQGQM